MSFPKIFPGKRDSAKLLFNVSGALEDLCDYICDHNESVRDVAPEQMISVDEIDGVLNKIGFLGFEEEKAVRSSVKRTCEEAEFDIDGLWEEEKALERQRGVLKALFQVKSFLDCHYVIDHLCLEEESKNKILSKHTLRTEDHLDSQHGHYADVVVGSHMIVDAMDLGVE